MQTILVTGATGFVGRALCTAIAARGDRVVVVSRDVQRARSEIAYADAFVTAVDVTALAGVDAIVNLAGEPVSGRWTSAKKASIRASRVERTRAIVEAIRGCATRPRVLVSASAIGFYGDRGDEVLRETSAPGDDFLAEVCVAWEAAANGARELGVRVVTARIGLVMGDGGALAAMRPMFALGMGGALGSGRQWWPWIHLDDLVAMLLFAIDRDVEGALDATAPEPVRQIDHARALARAMHRPAFVPAPAFALRALVGEFSSELLASRRVVPARATELGFVFAHADLGEALASIVR
jgi:uncharacterized protein (TIGR01777 family)